MTVEINDNIKWNPATCLQWVNKIWFLRKNERNIEAIIAKRLGGIYCVCDFLMK